MTPEELFHSHIRLVHAVAWRMKASAILDHDDYFVIGLEALWKAAHSFDRERSAVRFATFASYRIKTAIVDELRRLNGRKGQGRLQFTLGLKSLDEWMEDKDDDDDGRSVRDFPDERINIAGDLERAHDAEVIRRVVAALPEREAAIVNAYYLDETKFHVIAEDMGISESRVCQLHQRALGRMRMALA